MVVPRTRIEAALREHGWGTPTAAERSAGVRAPVGTPVRTLVRTLVQRLGDEAILRREALRLGLDSGDPVIERRLIQNLRFLGGPETSDSGRLQEARALGMVEGDLVVERRLVQLMEQRLLAEARGDEPAEEELAAHRLEQAARFTTPPRVRLSHVFFAVDGSEPRARARAERLHEQLVGARVGPDRADDHGDPFLAGPGLPQQSEAELAKLFGPELAAAAMDLPPGHWSPPLRSPHGFHLLWLHERVEAELPPLEVIRTRVRHSLREAQAEEALARGLRELRGRYRVRLEEAEAAAEALLGVPR